MPRLMIRSFFLPPINLIFRLLITCSLVITLFHGRETSILSWLLKTKKVSLTALVNLLRSLINRFTNGFVVIYMSSNRFLTLLNHAYVRPCSTLIVQRSCGLNFWRGMDSPTILRFMSVKIKAVRRPLSQDGSSVVEYYGQLKRAWEDIDTIDPPPCSCEALDASTCQFFKKIVARESNARLIHFLMGLNDIYETVKTHLLTMDPLPPLQKVKKQKELDDSTEVLVNSSTFQTVTSKDTSVPSWKKPKMDVSFVDSSVKEYRYCHSLGHVKFECFKLKDCSVCGRKGHAPENCFKLKYGQHYKGGKGSNKPAYRDGSTLGGYRRTTHNANVVGPLDDEFSQDLPFDPLSVDLPQSSQTSQQQQGQYDSQFINGLVTTFMDKVLKAISDNNGPMSSLNFAGIFNTTFLAD
ncbi:hypothetical protein vseg_017506 [Gypsophila vaccaria]